MRTWCLARRLRWPSGRRCRSTTRSGLPMGLGQRCSHSALCLAPAKREKTRGVGFGRRPSLLPIKRTGKETAVAGGLSCAPWSYAHARHQPSGDSSRTAVRHRGAPLGPAFDNAYGGGVNGSLPNSRRLRSAPRSRRLGPHVAASSVRTSARPNSGGANSLDRSQIDLGAAWFAPLPELSLYRLSPHPAS